MRFRPVGDSYDDKSNDEIFVFGSNVRGRHGAGAALFAKRKLGAIEGVGVGPQGRCYAIPTKGKKMETLTLFTIQHYVDEFVNHAFDNPELRFYVTAIGTGLAGLSHEDVAPLFYHAPRNCSLPGEWEGLVER